MGTMTTEWPGYPAPTTPAQDPSSLGYVIAHEGCDGSMGGPLYQHICGHVQMLALWEAMDHEYDPETKVFGTYPATGATCTNCGERGFTPAQWRLLWRQRSPLDRGRV